MNLEELMQQWEHDSKIDDNHLGEASTESPNLHSKYINTMVSYKLKLAKIRGDYNLLRKTKFRYYRGELSRQELEDLGWQQWQGVKPLRNEMDEFLQGDTDLVQMEQKVEYLNTIVYFLEEVLRQIRQRDWQIRTAVDWKKFLVGM
jgi:hypothetical protein